MHQEAITLLNIILASFKEKSFEEKYISLMGSSQPQLLIKDFVRLVNLPPVVSHTVVFNFSLHFCLHLVHVSFVIIGEITNLNATYSFDILVLL